MPRKARLLRDRIKEEPYQLASVTERMDMHKRVKVISCKSTGKVHPQLDYYTSWKAIFKLDKEKHEYKFWYPMDDMIADSELSRDEAIAEIAKLLCVCKAFEVETT